MKQICRYVNNIHWISRWFLAFKTAKYLSPSSERLFDTMADWGFCCLFATRTAAANRLVARFTIVLWCVRVCSFAVRSNETKETKSSLFRSVVPSLCFAYCAWRSTQDVEMRSKTLHPLANSLLWNSIEICPPLDFLWAKTETRGKFLTFNAKIKKFQRKISKFSYFKMNYKAGELKLALNVARTSKIDWKMNMRLQNHTCTGMTADFCRCFQT